MRRVEVKWAKETRLRDADENKLALFDAVFASQDEGKERRARSRRS
jgi:hypothetical protein